MYNKRVYLHNNLSIKQLYKLGLKTKNVIHIKA